MLLKILILGNRLVRTLKLYPSSLRKLLQPLLHLWGPYSTTVLLRDSGPLSGKWGNGHLYSKRETNKPKKIIARLQYSHLLGKVFEHLLCTQITTYYDHILYSRMTAYRKQHSCESTLIGLIEDRRKALDSKEKVYLLAMDMSQAFDFHHHSLTLAKLNAYGFRDSSLDLMRFFFYGRLNRVKFRTAKSNIWKEMKRGCRQGSSLGPLL